MGIQGSPLGKPMGLGETQGFSLGTQESSSGMLGSLSGTRRTRWSLQRLGHHQDRGDVTRGAGVTPWKSGD